MRDPNTYQSNYDVLCVAAGVDTTGRLATALKRDTRRLLAEGPTGEERQILAEEIVHKKSLKTQEAIAAMLLDTTGETAQRVRALIQQELQQVQAECDQLEGDAKLNHPKVHTLKRYQELLAATG